MKTSQQHVEIDLLENGKHFVVSIWNRMCSVLSTALTMADSSPDEASELDENQTANIPSESQEDIVQSSFSFHPERLSELSIVGSATAMINNHPAGDIAHSSDAFPSPGDYEFHLLVRMSRAYTGTKPAIPSSLGDTPSATLGVQGILDELNATLRMSCILDILTLSSFLKHCIKSDYDFGTAYGHLHWAWENDIYPEQPHEWTIQDRLCRNVKDCIDVWMAINGKEWPIRIPKDISLDLIWIKMLNLGAEYAWLDVLCYRQEGGPRDDLHVEEWKFNMHTLRCMYNKIQARPKVVIYLSRLGCPLSLKEGDLQCDQCWFRHAQTLQEIRD
ncbi:uncharacterized protein BT62DRAFT_923507 [Guyanagaster necrorhizus]|uniref:Heterokaryon incompatibility domain-containing protein n=1 Tax=Guyanagaster necrorhizus TaxID=856835 RepID=A0A9P8AMW0_9AGAR|nr:uncharacterized protein BT62DRAFT_923507 [Guyanagaster necrorhizus MCA 3950]KAG7441290.1 hypothetical protein BT62DRAFT_923507 [Guyanagaster necrorhizus MCA 3950]